jgi:hypothetical protein
MEVDRPTFAYLRTHLAFRSISTLFFAIQKMGRSTSISTTICAFNRGALSRGKRSASEWANASTTVQFRA